MLLIFYAALAYGYERSPYVNATIQISPFNPSTASVTENLSVFGDLSGQLGPAVIGERVAAAAPAEVRPALEQLGQPADVAPAVEPLSDSSANLGVGAQVDAPVITSDRAAVICSVFGDMCAKALRVAECESGPDYSADFNGYHIGPFQIATIHADKFAAHGWNYWTDGDDAYKNSVIALEILAARGYVWTGSGGWPSCGHY